MAIHAGNGPGLTPITIGQKGGSETSSLAVVPGHVHSISDLAQNTGTTDGTATFGNLQPYLAVHYNIALVGTFPSQNLDSSGTDPNDSPLGTGFVSGDEVIDESIARQWIAQLMDRGIDL